MNNFRTMKGKFATGIMFVEELTMEVVDWICQSCYGRDGPVTQYTVHWQHSGERGREGVEFS